MTDRQATTPTTPTTPYLWNCGSALNFNITALLLIPHLVTKSVLYQTGNSQKTTSDDSDSVHREADLILILVIVKTL